MYLFTYGAAATAAGGSSGRGGGAADGNAGARSTDARPSMDRAGSGQPEGGAKLQHYAGRISKGGRAHYETADGHDIGQAGTLHNQGGLPPVAEP